jgi:hypothetical protein
MLESLAVHHEGTKDTKSTKVMGVVTPLKHLRALHAFVVSNAQ